MPTSGAGTPPPSRRPRTSEPWVLGLSASHNGGACLLHGNRIVAAVQEERLSRRKRHRTFGARPALAVTYCLEAGGIDAADLDLVVLSAQGHVTAPEHSPVYNPQLHLVAHGVPWRTLSHHQAHAASAFAGSGFEDAAVLVVDGMGSPFEDLSPAEQAVTRGGPGDWETISLYQASGTTLRPLEKHTAAAGDWMPRRPRGMPGFRSLGGLFSAVAQQIFGDNMEAGKVMGLAPYGEPVFAPEDFFDLSEDGFAFRDDVPLRFSHDRRWPECEEEYQNLARSVQEALEVALLALVGRLHRLAAKPHLCYTGGVALNCVANERLFRESAFRSIYIPAAAEDSGPAVGAAYWGLWQLTGRNPLCPLIHDGMGRRYGGAEIDRAIAAVPGVRLGHRGRQNVLEETVQRLTSGQLGGWFQGSSELGPRALGQRSILADPRRPEAKSELNRRVKHREAFRPFAPAVLAEEAAAWFDLDGADPESRFMLRVWPFTAAARQRVPAVVHVDGSGRVQTVHADSGGAFYDLLRRFRAATGVPLLLNTSFNGRGEPIVETPEDALWCLLVTGLDFVVLEDRLVERDPVVRSLLDLVPVLTAESWTVEISLKARRFSAWVPPDTSLGFRVTTPWGPREEPVPGHLHSLLAAIDGSLDGWGLLDRIVGKTGRRLEPEGLVEALGRLRRASILTFERRGDHGGHRKEDSP